jgi:RNA-binding protein Musashi
MNNPSKKIFVGGVALSVDDAPFRAYFETFGRVVEAQIIRDRTTGRSRGFGFVTFHDESSVVAVVSSRHVIQGKVLCTYFQGIFYRSELNIGV